MDVDEAATDMANGAVRISRRGDKYRWREGRFERLSPHCREWQPYQASLPLGEWRVPEELAEPEVERWKREGDAFVSPRGIRLTSTLCMNDLARFVAFEFEGYKGLFPRSVMWQERRTPRHLSIYPSHPLDPSLRRVACAVYMLKESTS